MAYRLTHPWARMAAAWPIHWAQPIPAMKNVEINDYLRRELDKLDETERKVIIARFVSEGSQRDVAKEMNVSQMYISRLERRVLERLRAAYNE